MAQDYAIRRAVEIDETTPMYLIDRPTGRAENEITTVRYLFLIFVITPVLEMWLLITVGAQIGALPTIGLVLLTAFVGVNLLRYQGFRHIVARPAQVCRGQAASPGNCRGYYSRGIRSPVADPGICHRCYWLCRIDSSGAGRHGASSAESHGGQWCGFQLINTGSSTGASTTGFTASGGRSQSDNIIEGESWDEK